MSSRRQAGTAKRQAKGKTNFVQPNQMVKTVRTEILRQAERKFADFTFATTTGSSTGVLTLLTNIAQGSTVSTRAGDSLFVKSIVLRGKVETNSTNYSFFRFAVIRWLDNSTPTTAQILENVGTARCLISHYNHAYKKRFKVMYDSGCQVAIGNIGNPSSTSPINTTVVPNIIPMIVLPVNQKLDYDAASATDSNNRIYFCMWMDSANSCDIAFEVRTNYTDM